MPYKDAYTKSEIENILLKLSALGPNQVVLTGVSFENALLGAALYDKKVDHISYVMGPKYPGAFHGTGDVFSSVLLSCLLNEKTLYESTQIAVQFTYQSIETTLAAKQERRFGVRFESQLPYLANVLFNKKNT